MSVKDLLRKYGYGVAVVNNKAKTSCVIVTKELSKKDALKLANHYLKFPVIMLHTYNAWLKDKTIYFVETKNAKSVWAISRIKIVE